MPLSERTTPYKTWIKQSVVEALRRSLNDHPDKLLRETKATIDYPNDEAKYPAIVVRFFERSIMNAGVGHYEIIEIEGLDYKFKQYYYSGDLEFAIHALTSVDRDLIADSLVQIISMGDLDEWTNHFFNRIYSEATELPSSEWNYIYINTDVVSGFGETQTPAPWLPEDVFVYQSSYRSEVRGGFYSLPPETSKALGYIEAVDEYPYIEDIDPIPTGRADDPAEWHPPLDPS